MVKIFYTNEFIYDLPDNHRFPIAKYDLIANQIVYEGTIHQDLLALPSVYDEAVYLALHCRNYWKKLNDLGLSVKELRKIGLPLTSLSLGRAISSVAATIDAALFAVDSGLGINIGGGTHHAYRDRGEGFCFLNDLAVAANYLWQEDLARKILIVDLDVHQGNGTARIFQETDEIYTHSVHCSANYPLIKEQSNFDLAVPPSTGDQDYLELLERHVKPVFDVFKPDFVFFQAGVDVLESDRLGRLKLSREGCKKRDEFLIRLCFEQQIPLCITMGGGYSPSIRDIVEAHCNTIRTAVNYYE